MIVKPFSFLLFCFVSLGSRPQLMCVDQRKERAELLLELLKNGAGFDPLPVLTQVLPSPFLIVVIGVRATSLTRFVEKMRNIYISK